MVEEQNSITQIYGMTVLIREGSEIEDVIFDAIKVAKKYACKVKFKYNTESVEVDRDSLFSQVCEEFNRKRRVQ